MAPSSSDSEPVAGAVFGFTGTVSKDDLVASKRARATPELEKPTGGKSTLKNRAGSNARKRRRALRQRGLPRELHVKADHVDALGELQSLLITFNDPYAAGTDLATHIEAIPLLEARLLRTARIQTGHMRLSDIRVALSLLGNKALERELLELLEDMTEVKADLLEKTQKKG